jgi:predicted ribosome quality control (RQC) complex YloA/Tae2 family protein
MVTHYFTLQALSRELHEILSGSVITEVFSQQKDELTVAVEKNENVVALSISVDPSLNFIFVRDGVQRAKRNSVDLFRTLIGKSIISVSMLGYDRTILVKTGDENTSLYAALYNTSTSNIFIATREMIIADAFKQSNRFSGQTLPTNEHRFNAELLRNFNDFKDGLTTSKAVSIYGGLKELLPIFGSTYSREALHRARIKESCSLSALSEHECRDLFSALSDLVDEAAHPRPTIYFNGDTPRVFSVIELQHLSGAKSESFDTVNQGIRTCIGKVFRSDRRDDEKKELTGKLKKLLERTQRSIDAANEQAQQNARTSEYERSGSILMAHLSSISKGMTSITLPNIIDGGEDLRISLDPKLSPVRNAERFFEKSKKTKLALRESEERLGDLQRTFALLNTMLLHLDQCETEDQVEEFVKSHRADLDKFQIGSKKSPAKELPPFRLFTVTGGFDVWVGKSSENNDLLTMKYSKPNDLWFHARGSSGSHTVLKVSDTSHPPAREAINAAASIAAYYSKMRNAKNVPVAYCERKYVRKPKGAPAGTVTLEREKVIFVEPKLP